MIATRRHAVRTATPVWVGLHLHLIDGMDAQFVVSKPRLLGVRWPGSGTIAMTDGVPTMQPSSSDIEPLQSRHQTADPLRAGRASLRLEALGLMTAGIVHDLGNIIQILSSTVDVLDQHPAIKATKALQPTIGRALSSIERASGLITQILTFAREANAEVEQIDVALCLSGMERLLRWSASGGVRISIHVATDIPHIVCNRSHLENALLNLALNARDAMPNGGVLSISAVTCRDGGSVVGLAFHVADTGLGMTRETLARAFDPFFTTKANARGTGLGLTMVRRFAQEAGGTVAIESTLGAGTTVTVRLPLRANRQH